MSKSNFIDYVKIFCRSGHGGAGSIHFYRDKITAKGGPDGGNGGKGGHIILRGSRHRWTLVHLKYNRHVFAKDGENGGDNNRTGLNAEDIYIDVPLGTSVKDADTNEFVFEITEDGEEKILLEGGRGGMGNTYFKTPTKQAPRYAQPGGEGIEKAFVMELKILADVGLVGFPNAGKSTLISSLSNSKPKIADYPFTTLEPNLGIVEYRDEKSFVMADIPGIIEGAHLGKGLGHRFLRHIERNPTLLFMISVESFDIIKDYNTLLSELQKFDEELLNKKRILAITKCDIIDDELINEITENIPQDIPTIFISAVTQKNIIQLKDLIWKNLDKK